MSALGLTIFTKGFDLLAGWVNSKVRTQERKAEEAEATHTKRLEMIQDGQRSDLAYDESSNQQRKDTWMDDISFYTLWFAVISVFFPQTREHTLEGFRALAEIPPEISFVLVMMLTSIWGYRRFLGPVIEAMAKKYMEGRG